MNDDNNIWSQITEDIKPLTKSAKNRHLSDDPDQTDVAPAQPPIPTPPKNPNKKRSTPPKNKTVSPQPPPLTPDKIDHKTYRRIKRGTMPIDYTLDLHHMTRAEAKSSLTKHIRLSQQQGHKCFLVITGRGDPDKGTGVIRKELPMWLELSPLNKIVHAYRPAARHDGGNGAFYLLLRRKDK